MQKIDLGKYGITGVKEVIYNPSYEQLFQAEMDSKNEGFEKGEGADYNPMEDSGASGEGELPGDTAQDSYQLAPENILIEKKATLHEGLEFVEVAGIYSSTPADTEY